jgi:hypothetical protein
MLNLQKAGGISSLVNACMAVANMIIIFGVLGAEVAASPARVADIVRTQPFPLLLLECFKVISALAAMVTVLAMRQRLSQHASWPVTLATIAGVLSVILLLAAGMLGAVAIALANLSGWAGAPMEAGSYRALNTNVNGLGLMAVFANGIWYLFVSRLALKTSVLPRALCLVGLPLGVASVVALVVPPVALLVLLLGLVWAIWLGDFLLRAPAPEAMRAAIRSPAIQHVRSAKEKIR